MKRSCDENQRRTNLRTNQNKPTQIVAAHHCSSVSAICGSSAASSLPATAATGAGNVNLRSRKHAWRIPVDQLDATGNVTSNETSLDRKPTAVQVNIRRHLGLPSSEFAHRPICGYMRLARGGSNKGATLICNSRLAIQNKDTLVERCVPRFPSGHQSCTFGRFSP